jgi:hypothetical protein
MFLFCSHGVKRCCADLKLSLDPSLAWLTRHFPGWRPFLQRPPREPDFADIDFTQSDIRSVNRPAGQRGTH